MHSGVPLAASNCSETPPVQVTPVAATCTMAATAMPAGSKAPSISDLAFASKDQTLQALTDQDATDTVASQDRTASGRGLLQSYAHWPVPADDKA